MPLEVKWERTDQCYWHELMKINFSNPLYKRLHGVFIVWHGGSNPRVLFIGHGKIAKELEKVSFKREIKEFVQLGLYVTWAQFKPEHMKGVHRFLNDKLRPMLSMCKIEDHQIYVNLPF